MPHLNWLVRPCDHAGRAMSPQEAGYVGGIIDGEGTISVYARRSDGNLSHVLNEHVSVVNTDFRIVARIQEWADCGHIHGRDRDEGQRVCYTWQLDGQKAVQFLRQIQPSLLAKQAQCDLVLEVAAIRESRRQGSWIDYQDEDLVRLTQIVNRVAELNGGKRAPFTLSRRVEIEQRSRPGAPPARCEIEGCRERVQKGCGGMCLAHFRETQALVHTHRCDRCGKDYHAERTDQKFCSDECQWRASRLRREGKGEKRVFACPVCDKPVVTTDTRKLTCSPQCYRRMIYQKRKDTGYFERRKEQEAPVTHVTHCAHCGAATEALHVNKRFCSQKCQTAHWHETVQRPRLDARAIARESPPCPACGKEVDQTRHAGKTFCDAHCQAVHRARQKKLPADYQIEKQCVRCGVTFHTKFGKQKYCSDACNKAAYRGRAHPD